jgi:hypothetical protein
MPIVISEFEIVPDAPTRPEGVTTPRSTEPPVSRPPTPYELDLALRHLARRDARVRAD